MLTRLAPLSNVQRNYKHNDDSITYFIYVYESAMEEATDRQKVKHLPLCLSCIEKGIMVIHTMTCTTWATVKEALIKKFDRPQNLINQKKAF